MLPVRTVAIAVDLGAIASARLQEGQRRVQFAPLVVADAAQEPLAAAARLACDGRELPDLAVQHAALLPIHRDILDEAEGLGMLRVVLGQVGHHLDRAVQHHVKRQLFGQGAAQRQPVAALQADDAGGEVHRPGQRGFVFRRVRRRAPRVVFHAARALARDPVGVGATQPGVLDRFVRVDRDVPLRRLLDHAQVVVAHPLALVPFAHHRAAGVVLALDVAGVADIAGLDHVHAVARVPLERGRQLPLIVADRAGGLVVADQVHALAGGIPRQCRQVEVGGGAGEVEAPAVGEPVAVPARVPAFHQHAAEAVGGGEVDVAPGVGGGGAVPGAGRPGLGFQVQRPPHADVLGRREPAHVADGIGLVEVEDQAGFGQVAGALADLDRAPRRGERQRAHHRGVAAAGRERGTQHVAVTTCQVHAGVVHQCGLVQ